MQEQTSNKGSGPRFDKIDLIPLAAAVLLAFAAKAQAQSAPTQYWMDAATNSMSIPGMEDADMAGMMGGMMAGRGGAMGNAGGMGGPGRTLDLSLSTRAKPGGAEGAHAIPPSMQMGASLPLLPPRAAGSAAPSREYSEGTPEKPKGRILMYWGCGGEVRAGQPRVIDFSRSNPSEWGKFMAGRHVADRAARNGVSVWPNERDSKRVPREASLAGNHQVTGEGVPASLKFAIDSANDFLPALRMSAPGDIKGAVTVGWNSLPNSRGYFLSAMGSKGGSGNSGGDMILWSSSEQPEPGFGLMDYVPPASVAKFIQEKVVLPTSSTQCTIPKGIFAETEGAMVRMIAYGNELNLAYPPKPASGAWNPEWTARLRVKSTGMTMLGQDEARGASRGGSRNAGGNMGGNTGGMGGMPGGQDGGSDSSDSGGALGGAGGILRGIFGR